jgi:DNA-directed RNA polymerase subunit RPC12/RpoP
VPIISYLKALGHSTTNPVLEATVQCPSCKAKRTYQLTLSQLKNICDDHVEHRDAENKLVWVEGTTRLLKCPKCSYTTILKIAEHRGGTVAACNEGVTLPDGWWK